MAFYKQVDLRSRKAMTGFLSGHFRYWTMRSNNDVTSYAHNMKIRNLPLSQEEKGRLYELIECEGAYWPINDLIADFDMEHKYEYQVQFNGRSGGYLVLYSGGRRPSGYKSYCTACGQKNYKTVEEIVPEGSIRNNEHTETGNKCGRCGANARKNYLQTHMEIYISPGQGIDQNEDFSDWDMEQLRDRVRLIQEFDKLSDAIVAEAKYLANEYEAMEEIRMVPKSVMVLKEKRKEVLC